MRRAERRGAVLLEMRDVSKAFGATRALDCVSLALESGEVARADRGERCRQEHADEDLERRGAARFGVDESERRALRAAWSA